MIPVLTGVSAGFGRRFAALIYDSLMLAALLIIFTFASLVFSHGHAIMRDTAGVWYYLYCSGEIGVAVAYYIVNWMRSGQTLGMRAWHLRAVGEDGKPLALSRAALRILFAFPAWAFGALGVLWLYGDPEHLALQDRLSKTRVVKLTRS